MGAAPELPPAWVARAGRRRVVDARASLAAGRDPLATILDAAAGLAPGELLVVEAPFDPVPLRRLLQRRGFSDHVEAIAADHWRAYFCRGAAEAEAAEPAEPAAIWHDADAAHVDVRGLEPPEPMLAILRLIERSDCPPTVIVHHDREPIILYPELAERGWQHDRVGAPPGEVRLRLRRGPA
jgi:uncharacterized protein (DUF2249 family)